MQCPFCKETILDGAIKCKHCGSATKPKERWIMTKSQAIGIGVLLLVLGFFVPLWFIIMVMLPTSAWVAYDSVKIKASRYKSRLIRLTPLLLFVECLLCWAIAFPWYLYFRSRVLGGVIQPAYP